MAYTFDFSTLSSYEFENLAKDILSTLFPKLRFHCYGPGQDNGIDISDSEREPKVIGQAKHYQKSSWPALKKELCLEKTKFQKLQTSAQYYIFTTFAFSGSEKAEMLQIFDGIIPDASHIWGPDDISALLNSDTQSSREILYQNQKLVLTSINVLKMIFGNLQRNRSVVLCHEIEKNKNLFWPTQVFFNARKALQTKRAVMIDGQPGSGKTITSNMLLADFLSRNSDYEVLYAIAEEAKQILSQINIRGKQIIYVDDMLGQASIKLSSSEENSLKQVVALASASPCIYLILNTRTTVWRECQSEPFNSVASKIAEEKIPIINADEITRGEKARILYNHLFFRNVPSNILREIYEKKFYWELIESPGYSPRLIEMITRPQYLADNEKQYILEVTKILQNPKIIWEDEIDHHRSSEERLLLYCLCSFGHYYIPYNDLKKSFESTREIDPDVEKDKALFDSAFSTLNDSLIESLEYSRQLFCRFANPQIETYVESFLQGEEGKAKRSILEKSAIYLDQYVYLIKDFARSKQAIELTTSGKLLGEKGIYETPWKWLIKITLANNLFSENLAPKIQIALQEIAKTERLSEYSEEFKLIIDLLHVPNDPFGLSTFLIDSDTFDLLINSAENGVIVALYIALKGLLSKEEKERFATNYEGVAKEAYLNELVKESESFVMDEGKSLLEREGAESEDDIRDYLIPDISDELIRIKRKMGIDETIHPELCVEDEDVIEKIDFGAPLQQDNKESGQNEKPVSDMESKESIDFLFGTLV